MIFETKLKITIEANLKIVNFLDVTLNLNTGKYQPYIKAENAISYINTKSNHPPAVIKAVPKGINKRLSLISSDLETFNKCIAPYQHALDRSGYTHALKYDPEKEQSNQKKKKRQRTRKIIWFNPPFNRNVKSNVGKIFFRILQESFPKGHKLRKIFSKNSVKLSYRCTQNVASMIDSRNKKK